MKASFVVVFTVTALLTACGTLGGAISGAGQDLSKAGDWIKSK
jgi:predicted small secreted protein